MTNEELLTYRLPDPILPDLLAEAFEPSASATLRKRHRDAFVYLIGTIYQRTFALYDEDEDSDTLWIYLTAQKLRRVLGPRYLQYRDFLINQGILTCDEFYEPGVKSFGFQLVQPYRFPDQSNYFRIEDFTTRQNVVKFRKEEEKERLENIKHNHHHLKRHFDTGLLQIHGDEARAWIEARRQKAMLHGAKSEMSAEESAKKALEFVANVEKRDYHLSTDTTAQRFHSVITNCKRELRNFLHYGGQQLVSLDVKNCQPYLVEALFRPEFWDKKSCSFQHVFPEGYTSVQEMTEEKRRQALDLSWTTEEEFRRIDREIVKKQIKPLVTTLSTIRAERIQQGFQPVNFGSLSTSGQLYEWFLQNFKGRYFDAEGKDKFEDRDAVKTQVLWLLYLNPRRSYGPGDYYDAYKQFASAFPVEVAMMNLVKGSGYKLLPILLQRLESQLLLKEVARWLPAEVPVFTIHDSIATTLEYVDLVATEITQTFSKYLGTPPRVERQLWSPENLRT